MKKEHGRISIISRESDERTLDIALLEAELLKRGHDVKVLCKLLKKDSKLKALAYTGYVAKQEFAILRSDVVVLDTYCIPASMIPHRRGTKVVQMWHALSALKKFGWQTVGKEGGSSERVAKLMRMHRGYDYVVCPSDITASYFKEAFKVDESKMVKLGLPRIDYIKSVAKGSRKEDTLARIYHAYPDLQSSKKTILYAPTFRSNKDFDVQGLIDSIDTSKYHLVVKMHPLYRKDAFEQAGMKSKSYGSFRKGVIFDDNFTSFDWLAAADMVVSDYSSFVVESSLTDKPLYIYAPDMEDYIENTGLNMDFTKEPIAPYVFEDAGALAKSVDDEEYDFDALRAFRDRYIDIDTSNCTAALADFIETLL